jgi:ring-1,2-phenylacetyl-CoA epoxidase subunit PaaC
VRNFLYSALMVLVWDGLQNSPTPAWRPSPPSRSRRSYHLHHPRLAGGDGTDESHARVQAAVDHLMPYTEEFWTSRRRRGGRPAWRSTWACARPGTPS